MMLGLLMFFVCQAAQAGEIVRVENSIEIPTEIAPAVEPYLLCMIYDERQRINGSRTGDAVRAAIQGLLADCRQARDEAEEHARAMLRSTSIPAAEHDQIVSETLVSIDQSQDSIAARLDRTNRTEGATETP